VSLKQCDQRTPISLPGQNSFLPKLELNLKIAGFSFNYFDDHLSSNRNLLRDWLYLQMDSGSPLVLQNPGGTFTLQGIGSFGAAEGCQAAAVFTRVSNYLNWISRVTGILTP